MSGRGGPRSRSRLQRGVVSRRAPGFVSRISPACNVPTQTPRFALGFIRAARLTRLAPAPEAQGVSGGTFRARASARSSDFAGDVRRRRRRSPPSGSRRSSDTERTRGVVRRRSCPDSPVDTRRCRRGVRAIFSSASVIRRTRSVGRCSAYHVSASRTSIRASGWKRTDLTGGRIAGGTPPGSRPRSRSACSRSRVTRGGGRAPAATRARARPDSRLRGRDCRRVSRRVRRVPTPTRRARAFEPRPAQPS